MSASSKKKIRKEQNAVQLSERQRRERKEAKKLKIYSIVFTALIVAILVTAIAVMTFKAIDSSGLVNKLTTALTIGDHKINSVEMNYYYMDAVTKTYNQWETTYGKSLPTMISFMGLDLTKPLDEQDYYDEGKTWADYFMDMAVENAYSDYTLSDAAKADKFSITDKEKLSLESQLGSIEMQAMLKGYPNIDQYISAYYGNGATYDSYTEYVERSALASAYYNNYYNNLSYTADQISAHAAEHANEYTSFSYAEYELPYESFLGEGTTGEDGNVTHSDEEIAAARDAAKAAAEELAKATSLEALNAAIAAMEINKNAEEPVAARAHEKILYSSLEEKYQTWLTEDGRKIGDIGVLENSSTSTDADGNQTTTVSGYTVVIFTAVTDNKETMSNVRHLLVAPVAEVDEVTGEEEISEDAWNVAKETAEMHLREWKEADGTEKGFIELVKESSEDEGSVENGGLYENIHRDSPYEKAFLEWAIDPARTPGETGIVQTSYGYHIMYYVGRTEMTYHDYLITEKLRTADLESWFNDLKDAVKLTREDLSRVDTSSVLFAASNG